MRKLSLPVFLLFSLMVFFPRMEFAQNAAAEISPTEISADLGSCSALITVTGADSRPIFEAKVDTRVHYGFLGAKKVDLEAFSSAAGQVKIVGLPEILKKPVFIYISKNGKMDSVEFRPDLRCRATFDVQLK